MSREPHAITRTASDQDEVTFLHPDDGILTGEIEDGRDREQTIAKVRLLWVRRAFLLKLFAYGIAASLVIAFLIPTRYQSTVLLMPPNQESGGLASMIGAFAGTLGVGNSSLGGLAGVASDVLGMKTSGDLFIGILQSRSVEDDLINKFNLRKVYWDQHIEDARKDLEDRTDISADRKSGIITIKVTDRDPRRAAAMGQEYIAELNWVLINLDTSAAHRERIFLGERLKEVKQDLEVAEKNFSQFSSRNATLDVKEQGIAMVEAGANLEGQLIAAETQLQGLKQIYSDNNVRVRSVQARIDELRRQLQRIGGKEGADANSVDQYVDSLYPTIRKLPLLGVGYADLYRETKVDEATFEMLTEQYELAKVEEAKELPSVKVLDSPNIPTKKSFPPRLILTLAGGVMTLFLGMAWVLGQKRWEEVGPNDPARALAQDILNDLRAGAIVRVSKNGSQPHIETHAFENNEHSEGNQAQ